MKNLYVSIFLLLLQANLVGQTMVPKEQCKSVLNKINNGALAMKSMQCDFSQTKSVKMLNKSVESEGVMYFKRPNKLRWQYTKPYDYTFVLNDTKVHIKSAKSNKKIDTNDNKMFNQISNIILNCVTGGNLNNSPEFRVELYQSGANYFAKLYPKKKELKQVYNNIEIHFNNSLSMVNEVKMEEKTGETTIVRLRNTKINVAIDDKVFNIN